MTKATNSQGLVAFAIFYGILSGGCMLYIPNFTNYSFSILIFLQAFL